jgi:hypothetical protein
VAPDYINPASTNPFINERIGGAEEDRTPDLRDANATLSQLSYCPVLFFIYRGVLSHPY